MRRRRITPRRILTATLVACAVTSVLPLHRVRFLDALRGPFRSVVAPIGAPFAALSVWLRPGDATSKGEESTLRSERDLFMGRYRDAQRRIVELESLVRALQQGVAYSGTVSFSQVSAGRMGSTPRAGLIFYNAGSEVGVNTSAVAVAQHAPQRLVGRVVDVQPWQCGVRPVAFKSPTPTFIRVTLLADSPEAGDDPATAPTIDLAPAGDGSLVGEIGADEAARIDVDFLAHLNDPEWPAPAQMLVVGRVSVLQDTDKPLWKRIVVTPEFDASRVGSVILRVPRSGPQTPREQAGAP